MWTNIAIGLVLLWAAFLYWMVHKRKYTLKRLPMGKRLGWSILCIIPPLIVFITEPGVSLALIIIAIFVYILVFGGRWVKENTEGVSSESTFDT